MATSQSNLLARWVIGGLIVAITSMLLACNGARRIDPIVQSAEVIPSTTEQPPVASTFEIPTLTLTATTTPTATLTPTVTPTSTTTPTPTITPIALGDLSNQIVYTLPLTIRHVTDTGATLFFELSAPSEGILLYESAEEGQRSVPLNPADTRQQIVLEGLSPGIEYRAMVGLSSADSDAYLQPGFRGQIWGEVSFHTQSDKEPLRIGVVGDSGFGQQVTFDLVSQMADANLDLVLHTGDVVYNIEDNAGPFDAYALKYYLPFAPLLRKMPIYTVVGNHDVEQEASYQGTPFIYHAFPSFFDPHFSTSNPAGLNQWYAIDYGNIQFLMLNTQTFVDEPGRDEQTAWLTERLADERFAYSIPVFHVPPFSSGLHPYDGAAVRSEWVQLFQATKVPLVLSGHDHNYERLEANGITYIISGGGSTVLYDKTTTAPGSVTFAKRTHFVLLEIYRDRIDLRAVALGGDVLDQAVVMLN
jgi:predicted phosphodiesterase